MTYAKLFLNPSGSLQHRLDLGLLVVQVLISQSFLFLHLSVMAMLH